MIEAVPAESRLLLLLRTLRRIVALMLLTVVFLGLASRAFEHEPSDVDRTWRHPPVAPTEVSRREVASVHAWSSEHPHSGPLGTQPVEEDRGGGHQAPAGRPFGMVWDLIATVSGRGAPSQPRTSRTRSSNATESLPASNSGMGGAQLSSLQRWVENDIAPSIQTEVKHLLTGERSLRPRPPPPNPNHYACPGSDQPGASGGWASNDGSLCFDWCCCTCEWTTEWACPQRPGKPVPPGRRGYASDDGGPCFSYCCDDPDNAAADTDALIASKQGSDPSVPQMAAAGGLAMVGGVGLLALGAG
eukprot:scaffold199939_cov36-Tisochrysis_lutea.AAC.2